MSVSFNTIPQNLRQPLFYAEMDNSQAGYFSQLKRSLLIGHKLAAGSAVIGQPYLVASTAQAVALFGAGSMLARMHDFFRRSDAFGEVWVLPVAAPTGGAAATGTINVTGPASESGTISLYVAGQLVRVGVVAGDTANAVASAIAAAITAQTALPVTASASAAAVTLTARWVGLTGNDITISHSYQGQAGGEALPAGVGLNIVAMAGGAGTPDLAPIIAAMGDEEYDYIIHPFADSTSLNALRDELNDGSSGRWGPQRQIYGHAYTALRGALGALVSFGQTRNDPHATVVGVEPGVPNPVWEVAAAYGARNAAFLNADVTRPTQTGELTGILPARVGARFIWSERESLLNYGIATTYVAGGVLRVQRAITTYRLNSQNVADTSYLDSEDLHKSAEFLRRMRYLITSKYARHAVANNGTRFGPGRAIVTPAVVEGELDAEYLRMEQDGLVENFEAWKRARFVERDSLNPNRLNVLLTPDYVNALRVVGLVNQFRLQFPS